MAPTTEQRSASDTIKAWLAENGLPASLGDWAWPLVLQGLTTGEIYTQLRTQPEYVARYPAMAELARQGRAISEAQYRNNEELIANSAKQYGIPDGIYNTRAAVAQMFINDVSPAEVADRMRMAAGLVYSDPNIRQAFGAFYGTQGDGAAIAYLLDPKQNEPLLTQHYAAAQIAGNVMAQGLGGVSQSQAEMIALRTNPTEAQAQQAATQVGTQRDLYGSLYGETQAVNVGQGVSAALGADSTDVEAIDAQKRRRAASYQGGGGLAAGQQGISGLASAAQ